MRCAVGVLLWLTAGAMASFTALAAAPAATEADTALHAPYDGNHWAVLARAQIQARYLPAGLSDDGAILRAVADGTLREAVYPSLQLADDVAFITLKALARSTLDRRKDILGLCRRTDGFHLLLDDTGDCADDAARRLRFEAAAGGAVTCRDCAALGLPTRWERHDRPARCPLPAWDLAAAQQQFGAWRTQFERDMQPYLGEPTEALWQSQARAGRSIDGTVVPASRASAALIAMTTAPDAFAEEVGMSGQVAPSAVLARLLRLLRTAEVSGRGGLYREPVPALEATCAQVWYLRMPGTAANGPVAATDTFVRGGAPFITVQQQGGRIRLAGLSRELVEVLLAPAASD